MHYASWYGDWRIWLLVAVVLCLWSALIIWFVWQRITARQRHVRRTLENIADRLLRDAVLPDGMGTHVTVDAILLRDGKLHLLDIRTVEGAIFAGEKLDAWTVMHQNRRFTFTNPLHLMQDRVAALRALAPELPVIPHILFTAGGQFPKGRPQGVEMLDEFATPLLRTRKAPPAELDASIRSIWSRLCEAVETPVNPRRAGFSSRSESAPMP